MAEFINSFLTFSACGFHLSGKTFKKYLFNFSLSLLMKKVAIKLKNKIVKNIGSLLRYDNIVLIKLIKPFLIFSYIISKLELKIFLIGSDSLSSLIKFVN